MNFKFRVGDVAKAGERGYTRDEIRAWCWMVSHWLSSLGGARAVVFIEDGGHLVAYADFAQQPDDNVLCDAIMRYDNRLAGPLVLETLEPAVGKMLLAAFMYAEKKIDARNCAIARIATDLVAACGVPAGSL